MAQNDLHGVRVVTKDELAAQRERSAQPQPGQLSLFAMGFVKRDGDRLLRVDERWAVAGLPRVAHLPPEQRAHCPRCQTTLANAG